MSYQRNVRICIFVKLQQIQCYKLRIGGYTQLSLMNKVGTSAFKHFQLPINKYLIQFQLLILMMEDETDQDKPKLTLTSLIDSIEFTKPKKKKALSETESISSNPSSHTMDSELKEKSKNWTEEEVELLQMSLKKYGTDFHILSSFFPKKTKNQIKNKYKQLMALKKKEEKAEDMKLMAIAKMFKQVQQKQQQN